MPIEANLVSNFLPRQDHAGIRTDGRSNLKELFEILAAPSCDAGIISQILERVESLLKTLCEVTRLEARYLQSVLVLDHHRSEHDESGAEDCRMVSREEVRRSQVLTVVE